MTNIIEQEILIAFPRKTIEANLPIRVYSGQLSPDAAVERWGTTASISAVLQTQRSLILDLGFNPKLPIKTTLAQHNWGDEGIKRVVEETLKGQVEFLEVLRMAAEQIEILNSSLNEALHLRSADPQDYQRYVSLSAEISVLPASIIRGLMTMQGAKATYWNGHGFINNGDSNIVQLMLPKDNLFDVLGNALTSYTHTFGK